MYDDASLENALEKESGKSEDFHFNSKSVTSPLSSSPVGFILNPIATFVDIAYFFLIIFLG